MQWTRETGLREEERCGLRGRCPAFVFWICATMVLPGCYTYHTAPVDAVSPDVNLRLRLSERGVNRIRTESEAEGWGSADQSFTGEVVDAAPDYFLLEIPWAPADLSSHGSTAFRQRMRIFHEDVVTLEIRQLDLGKTGSVIAAIAAFTGLILVKTLTGESGGAPRTVGPPDPPEFRMPGLHR